MESLFAIAKQVGCDRLNSSQLTGQNDHLTDYYCRRYVENYLPHYLIQDDFSSKARATSFKHSHSSNCGTYFSTEACRPILNHLLSVFQVSFK